MVGVGVNKKMTEGWNKEQYFILADSLNESKKLTELYGISESIPEFIIVGLLGWDDFILCNKNDEYYRVPTVPAIKENLEPFTFPESPMKLESSPKYQKRIKWYIKPIVFGGSPEDPENMRWISIEEHSKLVKFWNNTYREITKFK